MTQIIVFAGSVRKGSLNQKLCDLAVKGLQERGCDVVDLSLNDYEMPLYNGDLEARDGVPDAAKRLSKVLSDAHGVFIAAPEYNASVTPLLKNAIDWVSRTRSDKTLKPFLNPVYALGAASDGAFGGYRGLISLRHTLELGVQARVLADMASVKHASKVLDDKGALTDEPTAKMLDKCLSALFEAAAKL